MGLPLLHPQVDKEPEGTFIGKNVSDDKYKFTNMLPESQSNIKLVGRCLRKTE